MRITSDRPFLDFKKGVKVYQISLQCRFDGSKYCIDGDLEQFVSVFARNVFEDPKDEEDDMLFFAGRLTMTIFVNNNCLSAL